MQVTVNGEKWEFTEGISVTELLRQLEVDEATIVVQRNEDILARADFAGTLLSASDNLELIRFVGGG